MGSIERESEARTARSHVPTLQQLFWGSLASRMRAIAHWRKRGALGNARAALRRQMKFEPLEPRLLLSADLAPQTAEALGDGLALLGARVDSFVSSDTAFDAHVPLLLKLETDPVTGAAANEAPTVGDLLGVPVDANGDGNIATNFFGSDSDEATLQALDQNGDGKVDAGEFLKGFFFDKVTQFLNSGDAGNSQDVADFLTDSIFPYNFFSPLDQTLDHLSGVYNVAFEVVDGHVADTTENPDAEATFSVGFQLTITHDVPIDLGLEADALKLLPFTGSSSDPQLVTVPVTSTLNFGFDFGVFTGGKDPADIGAGDFFLRKADPLLASVSASDSNFDFNLNVGFLGAQVVNGNFDLQADISTTLLDPNDPDALGFSDGQLGVEHADGTVTSADAVPSADLAHSVGFFLRIGNVGITTPVYVADNNAGSLAALETDIETALSNANLDGLINADIVGGHVRFSLVPTTDTPLNFDNESYSQFGVLSATPDGDGANSFEYTSDQTFLLSVGGALPHLVTLHFPDPAIEDIGFGQTQDANTLPAVVAPADGPGDGVLTADSTLNITVVTDDGTEHTEAVTVDSDDTDGTNGAVNTSLSDLADDINAALPGSISGLIQAFVSGGTKIGFLRLDGSVSAITVATGTNSGELGFSSSAATTLRLDASNTIQHVDLGDEAHLKIEVKLDTGGGTSTTTYAVAIPDNDRGDENLLASDIDAALDSAMGANRIDVSVSGGRIVLSAHDASVLAFSITTINESIDDLVADVNHALANAGLGSQVTASASGGDLQLTAAGGKSLEISKTLTFDAGVTYAELLPPFFGGTPDSGLFSAGVGAGSHAEFELPVHVLPGLDDASTPAIDNWNPGEVSIVGNFSPLDTSSGATAEYDAQAKRFILHFDLDPTMENQDSHVTPVPASGSLSEEIRLVNMAELLNFNLVSAESMVGLLGSLGTALQQISNSALFAGYDIPFAAAALSGLLNYTDKKNGTGLIDKLIFDGGGDGIDGTESDTNRLLKKVTFEGHSYLVPAFVTAQELGAKLHDLIGAPLTGAGGINPTYDTASNQLTYRVDLLADSGTTVTLDKAFQYDVSLSPFAKLTVDSSAAPDDKVVTLEGRTGLGMTFGVDLSPPGAVIDEDTKLSDLNGGADSGLGPDNTGVHIKTALAITGATEIWTAPQPNADDPTPPPPPTPQLTSDAKFDLSVDGGPAKHVTILARDTYYDNGTTIIYNKTMGDLVADVNNALVAAGVDLNVFKAASDGNRLVLTAVNPGTTFTITNLNSAALTQLGFTEGASGNPEDFVITDRNGATHAIVLDGLPADPTVGNVIAAINAQTGGAVTASLNGTSTGLRLVDNTGGGGLFSVDSVNASPALLDLGLFLAGNANDRMQNRFGDGNADLIEGGALSQVHLDRRFFVRDAAIRLDGLTLTTPDGGVPGEALFGIVGVDTSFSGTLYAEVNAALQNPGTKVPGSQVSLAQLFDQTNAVADPVVSKAREISFTPFAGPITAGGVLIGALSNASAVVVAVDDAHSRLILAHVQGTFQDGEALVQGGNFVLAVGADAQLENFGDFTLNVDVQDGFSELGFGPGFAALDGASYVVPVALTVFGDSNADPAVKPVASLDLSGIGDLAAFENLDYTNVEGALDGLEALLRDVDSNFALLNTKLPAINRSVSDLLSLIDGFAHSVGNADGVLAAAQDVLDQSLTPPPSYQIDQSLDQPAPRLQDIPRLLRGAFGLPNGVDPDASDAVNWVRLDFDPANHMLMARLSLEQTLSTKLGLDIEVGSGLPNLTSGGVLEVAGLLDVNLHFGIDLDAPSNAYVYDDSTIAASLDVVGEGQEYAGGQDGLGLVFYSSIGPLAVLIQDGDANIHVAFDLPGLDLGGSHRKLLGDAGFADFNPAHVSQDSVEIVLPMFYGGEGPNDFLGAFEAEGSLGGGLTISTPDFSSLAADIGDGTIPFDPFDNIQLAIDTVNVYLESLSDDISGSVLNTRLPFAGNQLADQLFIEEFRTTLVRALKEGIAAAVDPDPGNIIQDLLTGVGGVFAPGGALNGYLQAGSLVYSDSLGGDVNTRYRQWNFTLHHVDSVTLSDFDVGIPGLTFDVDTPVQVNFDWTMDLGFGVNFGKGAYID
ncbi:MAG TPA: LEPR-XLL domain-containing protein, partial [Acidimicrobiales bacterium]